MKNLDILLNTFIKQFRYLWHREQNWFDIFEWYFFGRIEQIFFFRWDIIKTSWCLGHPGRPLGPLHRHHHKTPLNHPHPHPPTALLKSSMCLKSCSCFSGHLFEVQIHFPHAQSQRHPRTFSCSDYKLKKWIKVHNQNADLIFNTWISQSLITSKFSSFRNKNFVRKVLQMLALNIFIWTVL